MTDLVVFCCSAGNWACELGEGVTPGWECYSSKAVPQLKPHFHPPAAFGTAVHIFVEARQHLGLTLDMPRVAA